MLGRLPVGSWRWSSWQHDASLRIQMQQQVAKDRFLRRFRKLGDYFLGLFFWGFWLINQEFPQF